MSHGFLQFRTASLHNCRESYLRNIGDVMQTLVPSAQFEALRPLISAWQHELDTMPPGCFALQLGHYLTTRDRMAHFLRLFTEVIERLKRDPEKPNTLAEAYRIQEFVRSQMVEPGAAPNGGPATPVGNSAVTEGPPSVN
jgi:hypothetical protein